MAEQYVGKTAEFKDGDRRIIFAGENEIGRLRHDLAGCHDDAIGRRTENGEATLTDLAQAQGVGQRK